MAGCRPVSGIPVSDRTLDCILSGPLKMVPGSAMTYDGVADPKELSELVAYLKQANDTPECRKPAPQSASPNSR